VAFLASIGTWILKLLLDGLFKTIQNKEAEAARRQADAAKIAAESAQDDGDLELQIAKRQQEVANLFKDKALPDDDPFGFRAFNSGGQVEKTP
jgi:hypothetical protein